MIELVQQYLRRPQMRTRIIFTLFILVVYRALIYVTLPSKFGEVARQIQPFIGREFYISLDIISGGAISNNSIVSLGIAPYVTAVSLISIVTPFIPQIEELQKEGEAGRNRLILIQYVLTVVVALLTAFGLVSFSNLEFTEVIRNLAVVLSLVAGTMMTLWLGQLVDEFGISRGITIIFLGNTLSQVPYRLISSASEWGFVRFFSVLVIIFIMVLVYICLREAVRKIPVQYAKRVRGYRVYGGQSSFIPVRAMPIGVDTILTVFSDLLLIIGIFSIIQSFSTGIFAEAVGYVIVVLSGGSDFSPVLYAIAIAIWATFVSYVKIGELNMADALMRSGGFIPGIRPGQRATEYYERIASTCAVIGVYFLTLASLLPRLIESTLGVQVPLFVFVGIWNVVDILVDMHRQVEANNIMANYEGISSR